MYAFVAVIAALALGYAVSVFQAYRIASDVPGLHHNRVVKRHVWRLLTPAVIRVNPYRKQAHEFRVKAWLAVTREAAKEFYELAEMYTRLAEQAERNSLADLVYEPPPPKLSESQ